MIFFSVFKVFFVFDRVKNVVQKVTSRKTFGIIIGANDVFLVPIVANVIFTPLGIHTFSYF